MEKDHAGDTLALEKDGLFIVLPDGSRENLLDYGMHPDRTRILDCVKHNRQYSFVIGEDPITCENCGRIFQGIFYRPELCLECIDQLGDRRDHEIHGCIQGKIL